MLKVLRKTGLQNRWWTLCDTDWITVLAPQPHHSLWNLQDEIVALYRVDTRLGYGAMRVRDGLYREGGLVPFGEFTPPALERTVEMLRATVTKITPYNAPVFHPQFAE